jgi:hypothetical protein
VPHANPEPQPETQYISTWMTKATKYVEMNFFYELGRTQ